jgi:type VI protein secretion system component Hcp
MTREVTMGAIKKRKAAKQLRKGKKMEAQKPLSVTQTDLTITKNVDVSSPKLF